MSTFATELSFDIRKVDAFWVDLANLRASGIRSTLLSDNNTAPTISGPEVDDDALTRLLNSANVFAQATDEVSRDLAQQIAVFASLASMHPSTREAAKHILAGLGNFPGLDKIKNLDSTPASLQAHVRNSVLRELNTVDMADKRVALTEFQLDVWESLLSSKTTAISAPTSAGKSFVVLEHLCKTAAAKGEFVALYIAPTRALLAEIQSKLERRLSDLKGSLRVTTVPVPDPENRSKQIYVLTQERVQLLLSAVDVSNLVDLVIVDEAQAIGDDSRGMILQDALDKIRASNPRARFLFLAPGATGFELVGESVGLDDMQVKETTLSPVVQNRINVRFSKEDEHLVQLSLVTNERLEPIGAYTFERGFALDENQKLAAVAVEFGASGRSLVYATGAANAEHLTSLIALSLPDKRVFELKELSKFIEQHIHKEYSLARFVRHGAAFHYGNMPALLREGIENSFRNGHLDYLCCTTTLFQGVNLPARNVFIDTPTRGNRGELLDEASLWNFAGRAGRLGEEVVGNVFLVNYDNWNNQPLTNRKPFQMKVAFKDTLENQFEDVVEVLNFAANPIEADEMRKPVAEQITAAAGLVLLRKAQGSLEQFLGRGRLTITRLQIAELSASAEGALQRLDLPHEVLANSWMIDPVALASLHRRLKELVRKGEMSKTLPLNPATDSYKVYDSIFRRMFKHLGGMNLSGDEGKKLRGYTNHVTVTALKWMRGEPLTQLVQEAVRFKVTQSR